MSLNNYLKGMLSQLPQNTALLPGRNDEGKRVEINSVGEFFSKEYGTVVFGPYEFPYTVKVKEARKAGQPPICREVVRQSVPQYYVRSDRWKRSFTFLESEITILEKTAEVL